MFFSKSLLLFPYSIVLATTMLFPHSTFAADVSTTVPLLPQCNGCPALQARNLLGTSSTVMRKENVSGTECTQIITCSAVNGSMSTAGSIHLTVRNLVGSNVLTQVGSFSTMMEVNCKNEKWYLIDNRQISNIYDCQKYVVTTPTYPTFTKTTTPGYLMATRTTTSPKPTPPILNPTVITPLVPTVSRECSINGPLFQIFTASADPSSSQWGKFAGYFKSRAACQKLCNQNYKEKCYAYMYEPKNRGTCTIFQDSIYGKIIEKSNSKISIYKKCVKMPPAVSAKCCGELVQYHPKKQFTLGNMRFEYNDDTCRSTANITCQQPQNQGLKLSAAIYVNEIHPVKFGFNSVSIEATCNNGIWQISNPQLNVAMLECLLTDS